MVQVIIKPPLASSPISMPGQPRPNLGSPKFTVKIRTKTPKSNAITATPQTPKAI